MCVCASVAQVAQKVCEMFQQCQQDRLTEVREQNQAADSEEECWESKGHTC